MKVTVITPVLNGASTIRQCIESVLNQDYENIEYIVVDGCSTDGTVQIAREYGIACISEKDAGIYDAFSKGVALATGDVINILNADDFYSTNNVVSAVVTYMNEECLDLVHGLIEQIDENEVVIKQVGKDLNRSELLNKMRVAHPSVFVRRAVYQQYGSFSVGFRVAGDHEFLSRVWDKISIGFLPVILVSMRLGGVSNNQCLISYRESMAVALLHGKSPILAIFRYYFEILKVYILKIAKRWQ